MTEIRTLRRMLHVESAHRIQLESSIEILNVLLAESSESAISTRKNVKKMLEVVLMSGRQARQLDARYKGFVRENFGVITALEASDVSGLLGKSVDTNLPGLAEWLLEQRPDLDQAMRDARVDDGIDDTLSD